VLNENLEVDTSWRSNMAIMKAMIDEIERLEEKLRIAIEGLTVIKNSTDPMGIAGETLDAISKVSKKT
tara:strand:+ start:352 stop:555 length:204 start_codon:yes stop_codon:yes gene_type:complete